MSIEFRLPSIGEGIESADVAEILVAVGDMVAPEQIVMELETEKAVVELPCPLAGRVTSINVSRGDSVTVGAVLFTVEQAAAVEDAPPPAAPAAPAAAPAKKEPSPKPAASTKPAPPAAAPVAASKAQAPAPRPATGEREASPERPAAAAATGTIEFALPNIGEGVASADVAEILVKEGERIEAGQVVMELETEKAVVELPAPHAGVIRTIHIAQGDTITVGQMLLTMEGVAATPPASSPPQAPLPQAQSPKGQSLKADAAPAAPRASREAPIPTVVTRTTSLVSANGRRDEAGGGGRSPAPAAPSTRRMARELGVDLHQVAGSGPGGRITHEDVQAYVRGRLQSGRLPAVAPASTLAAGSIAAPPLPDFTRFGLVERSPMNKIARTAAENLSVSWNVIPHVTQHDRADITAIEAARKRFGDGLGKNGPKVTMTAVVMKALATCLQAFPKFNSSLDPETNEIVLKRYYNIGCAVDTEHGLLVPVVRECDRKSILDIASELGDLAAKARERKLPVDAMQGATCTVTNLGGIGGVGFTPIVNYPEVCILGMSRGQSELKMVDGQVTERMMLPLSLSYDHRVINGADAARFVVALCNMLSDPFQLLSAI